MSIETTINIEHDYTSYFDRVKYHVLILIGFISFAGIIAIIDSPKTLGTFITVLSLCGALYTAIKIYRNKLYIMAFYSDSNDVKIEYLNVAEECSLKTSIDKLNMKLRNTSSRAGFNCELLMKVDNLNFTITKDHDWNFRDIKHLFHYYKDQKKEVISEKEKLILDRIDQYLTNKPF